MVLGICVRAFSEEVDFDSIIHLIISAHFEAISNICSISSGPWDETAFLKVCCSFTEEYVCPETEKWHLLHSPYGGGGGGGGGKVESLPTLS